MFTYSYQTQDYVGITLENEELTHGVTELLVSPVYLTCICCEGGISLENWRVESDLRVNSIPVWALTYEQTRLYTRDAYSARRVTRLVVRPC